jgi:hypothetical protein
MPVIHMTLVTCFCLALAALSCSSQVAVNADYDTSADFTKYKTYAWLDQVVPADKIPEGLGADNDITDRRIRNALTEEMAAKGFVETTTDPDLVIFYHIGVEDKVDVTDWGYSYASTGRYWGWDTRNVDTYEYQEGILIVDFVDAKSKVLVWRGTAQKVLGNLTPEEADQAIKDIVKKLMTLYPPTGQAPQTGSPE